MKLIWMLFLSASLGAQIVNPGGGGSAVSDVSNSDGTLTISPTTGSVVASLNLAHGNTWSAQQFFGAGLGISSGQVLSWNADTGISRGAANVIDFGNGTQGSATAGLRASNLQAGSTASYSSNGTTFSNNIGILWTASGTFGGTTDVGVDRSTASVAEVNNGTIGNANGNLRLATLGTTLATIASATTIAPTTSLSTISGTATISTITPPTGFDSTHGGCIDILASGVWSTTTGGNISTVVAATVSGTLYRACYFGTTWVIK